MLSIDPEKCSGCCRCEVNCSFFHSGRVGRNGARIRVVKIEETGIDFPVVCRQCQERYCTKCPESAISIGDYGQVVVSTALCTGCGTCEHLCPIGAIQLYEGIPLVCDLCGGDPRCVKACTMGAISFEPDIMDQVSLKPYKKKRAKTPPGERRLGFALSSTGELRQRWLASRGG
ncbi:MAG: 4Fe-4S dicluster domain-containing protein [Deltaproteobacteria bacterium]|nr:4Fe-4S dicluster domain-containing protein [Deltaproteobacteria bacterium]